MTAHDGTAAWGGQVAHASEIRELQANRPLADERASYGPALGGMVVN